MICKICDRCGTRGAVWAIADPGDSLNLLDLCVSCWVVYKNLVQPWLKQFIEPGDVTVVGG